MIWPPDPCTLSVISCGYQLKAYVTEYTLTETGFNHGIMASGRRVFAGAVACPRALKLGQAIMIGNALYSCQDRYSAKLDALRGLPTFDVFVDDYKAAKRFGKKLMTVIIL